MSYASGWKFFQWLRDKLGISKPVALGWDEWDEWDDGVKTKRPIAYFFTETFPDAIDWLNRQTLGRLESAAVYLRNRFVYRPHIIPTGLPKGQFHEIETRIMHGAFTALVDFVEVECAHMNLLFQDAEQRARFKYPWWRKFNYLHWKKWRCPESGIAHLYASMELDDPDHDHRYAAQAESARETFDLYYWWKYARPNRKSIEEASGMDDFEKRMAIKYGKEVSLFSRNIFTQEEKNEGAAIMQAMTRIETEQLDEDDEMLMRLIKHRAYLWT